MRALSVVGEDREPTPGSRTPRRNPNRSAQTAGSARPRVPRRQAADALTDVDHRRDLVVEPREVLRHCPIDASEIVGLADEEPALAVDARDELADGPLCGRRPTPERLEQAVTALQVVLRIAPRPRGPFHDELHVTAPLVCPIRALVSEACRSCSDLSTAGRALGSVRRHPCWCQ